MATSAALEDHAGSRRRPYALRRCSKSLSVPRKQPEHARVALCLDSGCKHAETRWTRVTGVTCNLAAARPALNGQRAPALVESHDGLAVHCLVCDAANVSLAHVWTDMHHLMAARMPCWSHMHACQKSSREPCRRAISQHSFLQCG